VDVCLMGGVELVRSCWAAIWDVM